MEKLLHERLKEWATDGYKEFTGDDLIALADEIERYYRPHPRDNEGIPFIEGETVYSVDPDTEYSAEIISVGTTTLYILWEDGKSDVIDACDMQHEKPQPKALDVDGVEIKVGDTVWCLTNGGQKGKARYLYSYGVQVEWEDGYRSDGVNPDYLTHKEPDSLEKLRDDMINVYAELGKYEYKGYADRLSALIERGA